MLKVFQLHLTPRETERLRQVSYERQVKAGFKRPGRAGLTVDRFGDAEPWVPRTTDQKYEQVPLKDNTGHLDYSTRDRESNQYDDSMQYDSGRR